MTPPSSIAQISSGGGTFPQWSPDGRQLFFESTDNRILVADIAVKGDSLTASKPRVWNVTFLLNFADELRRRIP
jgi:Tol biopolymer transport system component